MLLTKEVELRLKGRNIKRYEDMGYYIPRYEDRVGKMSVKEGTIIIVKIEDLSKGSGHLVDIQCDYCGKIVQRPYNDYIYKKTAGEKDSCNDCKYDKIKELNSQAAERGEIGYWTQYDNIVKEFLEHIKVHKNINNIKLHNKPLNYALQRSEFSKYDLLQELGLDVYGYTSKLPSGWYKDFNRVKSTINKLANKYGTFPSYNTIIKETRISTKNMSYHGGYAKVIERMGGEHPHKDNSGYYNNSFYEVIVANFLIESGLQGKYKREALPFPDEGNYRSDFYFKSGDAEYYCEVWGYDDGDYSINNYYNAIRDTKEELYKKHNHNLISIEGWKFDKTKYEDICEYLYDKFKPIFNIDLDEISPDNIIPGSYLTDEEIFSRISHLAVGDVMPKTIDIQSAGLTTYYNEIIRRYPTYKDFVDKFNMKVGFSPNGYWNEENIFESFDYMIQRHGRTLIGTEFDECNDEKISKLYNTMRNSNYEGYTNSKIKYFLHIANQGGTVPLEDCVWLHKISKGYRVTSEKSITEQNRKDAYEILRLLDKNCLLEDRFKDYNYNPIYTGNKDLDVLIYLFKYMHNTYGKFLSYPEYDKARKTDVYMPDIYIRKLLDITGKTKEEIEELTLQHIGRSA